MARVPPHQRVLDTLRALDPPTAQNRLLRVADRDLALAMIYMSDWQHDFVLRFVGGSKGDRVRQELDRYLHVRVTYEQHLIAVDTVARVAEGRSAPTVRAYYRPIRPSRDGGRR